MFKDIRDYEWSGPVRFGKMAFAWVVLVFFSVVGAWVVGRPTANLVAFFGGFTALFGPFTLETVNGLRWSNISRSFMESTYFFLFPSYKGLRWYFDARIWIGRISIAVGFVVSLLAIWSVF